MFPHSQVGYDGVAYDGVGYGGFDYDGVGYDEVGMFLFFVVSFTEVRKHQQMIGSVYRNQIQQIGLMELFLPLLYKFYPYESEILETLKSNNIVEDIVRSSNRTGVFGAGRHMKIKFLYTAAINYDSDTHLIISLKGLDISDEFRFCTRQRPGHVMLKTGWNSASSDEGPEAHKHTAEIFNGLAKIRMENIMHGSLLRGNTAREMEFYMMDVCYPLQRICLLWLM